MYNNICRKDKGYKEQDHAAKRKVEHQQFIAADWLAEKISGCCSKCRIRVSSEVGKGKHSYEFDGATEVK